METRLRSAERSFRWLLGVVVLVTGCSGGNAATSPSAPPTAPRATPNPHLREPARVATIYGTLGQRGIPLVGTNAVRGTDPVVVINATYDGWPLVFTEYRSSATRGRLSGIRTRVPGPNDAPFTFAGMNVVVHWGPRLPGRRPAAPPAPRVKAAAKLAAELHRLIGPLSERSARPVAPR